MSQPKRYVVCPNCGMKLYHEDLILYRDFNALQAKLLAKAVLCKYCGYKLKEVKHGE